MTKKFNIPRYIMEIANGYSTVEQLVEKLKPLGWKKQQTQKGILLLKNTASEGGGEEPAYCGIIKEQNKSSKDKTQTHYVVFLKYNPITKSKSGLDNMTALLWLERYACLIEYT